MFTINRVVLVGRLTRDPELRALPSGTSVCSLRIACNSSRRAPDGGDYVEQPNYFDVSVYGAPGESVSNHIRKGARVGIDGRLTWREWENSAQERRQAVSIVADTVQFLDAPGGRSHADAVGDEHAGGDAIGEEHEGGGEEDDRELIGVGAGDGDDELAF